MQCKAAKHLGTTMCCPSQRPSLGAMKVPL